MDELNVPAFIQPQMHVPINERRVGFGLRLGAALLDWVIIWVLCMVTASVLTEQFAPLVVANEERSQEFMRELMPSMPEQTIETEGIGFIIKTTSYLSGFVTLIVSLMEIFAAATPAKMLLGISIRDAVGVKASAGALAQRWTFKHIGSVLFIAWSFSPNLVLVLIASLVSLVFFVGCFFCLGERRLALHDMFAKTAVFRNDDLPALSAAHESAA